MQPNRGNALVALAAVLGLSWCVVVATELPRDPGFTLFAVVFIAIGVTVAVLSRRIARSSVKQARRLPRRWGANFWETYCEARLELFYKVVGFGIVATGVIVVVKSVSVGPIRPTP